MGIRDWPAAERPREKLLAQGARALSEAELLALLLGGAGRGGLDAVGRARELLARHGTLRGLLSALSVQHTGAHLPPGLGLVGYCRVQASLELARRHYEEAMRAGPALDSPGTTQGFLRARLRDSPHELFCCLHLDLCVRKRYVELDQIVLGFSAFE